VISKYAYKNSQSIMLKLVYAKLRFALQLAQLKH